jgi:hypothetical protein
MSTCAVLLLVLPMVIGHELGWPLWTFGCSVAGLVLAAAFVRVERRLADRGGDPLLNLDVLRARGLAPGIATLACTLVALGGFMFAFTLHLQTGLGESALHAGLTWLPFATAFGLVGYFWRSLPSRLHHLVVPVGLALCTLGYAGIGITQLGAGSLLWPALVLAGAGMGLSASPLVTQALTHVPVSRAADASGILTTTIQLSQVGGVTAFGTLFLSLHSDALATTSWSLALMSAIGIVAGGFLARSVR